MYSPVSLVPIGGAKIISGGNGLATGPVSSDLDYIAQIVANAVQKGFAHVPEPGAQEVQVDTFVGREAWASMFGPTTGDRVRLGDTGLWIAVENDTVRTQRLRAQEDMLIFADCIR